jgi:DNA-binding IscR family transcriptional regulator
MREVQLGRVQDDILEVLDAVRLVDLAKHLLQGTQEERRQTWMREVQVERVQDDVLEVLDAVRLVDLAKHLLQEITTKQMNESGP